MDKNEKAPTKRNQMTLREEAEFAALALRSGSHAEGAEILHTLGERYRDTRTPLILRAVEEGRYVDAADLLDLSIAAMK